MSNFESNAGGAWRTVGCGLCEVAVHKRTEAARISAHLASKAMVRMEDQSLEPEVAIRFDCLIGIYVTMAPAVTPAISPLRLILKLLVV